VVLLLIPLTTTAPFAVALPTGRLRGVALSTTANQWDNYGDWLGDALIQRIQQTGSNVVVLQMTSWVWDNNPVSPKTHVAYRDNMIRIVNSLRSQSLMVVVQAHGNTQKINDFTPKVQADLIMDTPTGSQDKWIASWSDVVRTLNPDGIVLMNEPPGPFGDSGYAGKISPEDFSRRYWNFATRMCQAYSAINPNMRLYVMSSPYWRMDYIVKVNSPINVPNVVYEWHYYPFFGLDAALDQLYTQGQLKEAAAYMEDLLLNTGKTAGGTEKKGLKMLMDLGLPLFCGEMGVDVRTATSDASHWKDRMRALYAFMDKYNLDYVQYDFFKNPWSTDAIRCGMLNADATTYNEIGNLWLANLQSSLILKRR
jgi:hypothetical protein